MYFSSWTELQKFVPIQNGVWNKERLCEYLIQSCNASFKNYIDQFFSEYETDKDLADMLFDILLEEDYEGSDAQMGAAHYISKLSKQVLRQKKECLLQAQAVEVFWKRPFQNDDYLKWLSKQ